MKSIILTAFQKFDRSQSLGGILLFGATIVALLVMLNLQNLFPRYLHLACGIIIWYLFLKSGIHPTIAGVLLAFTVPLRQKTDAHTFTDAPMLMDSAKIGIMSGSLVSGVAGYLMLRLCHRGNRQTIKM